MVALAIFRVVEFVSDPAPPRVPPLIVSTPDPLTVTALSIVEELAMAKVPTPIEMAASLLRLLMLTEADVVIVIPAKAAPI
jgi:hypothetical protein